jgi:kumamolisin
MDDSNVTAGGIPSNYVQLEGSERRPSTTATLLGPANPDETITVTIVLRRRPDGPPLPGFSDIAESAAGSGRLSADDFAEKYGASPSDIQAVSDFVRSHGLTVEETNPARRTVVVSGAVSQMSNAFALDLHMYEHNVIVRPGESAHPETYRGRNGFIHVPESLSSVIVGVFGLDNRRITKRNTGDPPHTSPLSTSAIAKLYNFPTNSAHDQTIAILSEAGYLHSDISLTFGSHAPSLQDVNVDASNTGEPDPETTQDICIAAAAAPGAAIAVYFTSYSQDGWVNLVSRIAHPDPGDPVCSVLSSSFYVANGDDDATLANEGISTSWLTAVSMAFQDAAIQHVTICIASGDTGTQSKVTDGKAHVQYPASDPWVLSVGGTTIGNVSGSSFDEYVWNDTFFGGDVGATGGGISDFFDLPDYQANANVPPSLNQGGRVGRGVPDVSANASPNAAYSGMFLNGSPSSGNGTSASAPLWAGLIAVINAGLGHNVGFVNPKLYALGSSVFRDIVGPPGPANNGLNGVPGYPATAGWDACTGWGSPNGMKLLQGLQASPHSTVAAPVVASVATPEPAATETPPPAAIPAPEPIPATVPEPAPSKPSRAPRRVTAPPKRRAQVPAPKVAKVLKKAAKKKAAKKVVKSKMPVRKVAKKTKKVVTRTVAKATPKKKIVKKTVLKKVFKPVTKKAKKSVAAKTVKRLPKKPVKKVVKRSVKKVAKKPAIKRKKR